MLLLLIVGDPLVDFIGDANHLMLLAKMGDVFQLFQGEDLDEETKIEHADQRRSTLPIGLFGLLTMINRVRELNIDSSSFLSSVQSPLDETSLRVDSTF